MFDSSSFLTGFAAILALALITWSVSLVKRDVSIVDSVWPLLFLVVAASYAWTVPQAGPRTLLVLVLVGLWALRLAGYLTWRNWGEPEDRRYQEIRRRNEPHFALKSLYIVFGLQGTLAWIISLPLLAAIAAPGNVTLLDCAGVALWAVGFGFESVADWQLARFKNDPTSRGQVMDKGLWRYTRHPNYFGDCCVWWGFYIIAFAAGGWWSILGPILMSFLLLKVSGVALLEKDIGERRPAYRDYIRHTNAFLPGPPKPPAGGLVAARDAKQVPDDTRRSEAQ
jgi:steroid 5-alpha reductase family enzyme